MELPVPNSSMHHREPKSEIDDTGLTLQGASCTIAACNERARRGVICMVITHGHTPMVSLAELKALLAAAPLLASVQASPGPVDSPEALLPLALASIANGSRVIRLQGAANIAHIRPRLGGATPVVGLIKEVYANSEIFITPTSKEVEECLRLGVEIIALDGAARGAGPRSTLQPSAFRPKRRFTSTLH